MMNEPKYVIGPEGHPVKCTGMEFIRRASCGESIVLTPDEASIIPSPPGFGCDPGDGQPRRMFTVDELPEGVRVTRTE